MEDLANKEKVKTSARKPFLSIKGIHNDTEEEKKEGCTSYCWSLVNRYSEQSEFGAEMWQVGLTCRKEKLSQ